MIFLTIDVEPLEKEYPKEKAYSWIHIFDNFISQTTVPFTLFITPDIFKRYSALIKKWSKLHEIGLHVHPLYLSYKNDYLNTYNPKIIKEIITKGLKIAKKFYKRKITSFRAARWMFHKDLPRILSELGFTHDSSLFPNAFSTNIPKKINRIIEISPSIWTPFPIKLLYKFGFFSSGGFVPCDGLLKTSYYRMIYPATKVIVQKHHLVFACHSFNFEYLVFTDRFSDYLKYLQNKSKTFAKLSELKE